MSKAFGIVNFAGRNVHIEGMQTYRPVGAFSFLGRYRVIDFPISNMSNSGIDRIQVYIRRNHVPSPNIWEPDVITTSTPREESFIFFIPKTVWIMISTTMILLPLSKIWSSLNKLMNHM